jgi:carbonic anhydrase
MLAALRRLPLILVAACMAPQLGTAVVEPPPQSRVVDTKARLPDPADRPLYVTDDAPFPLYDRGPMVDVLAELPVPPESMVFSATKKPTEIALPLLATTSSTPQTPSPPADPPAVGSAPPSTTSSTSPAEKPTEPPVANTTPPATEKPDAEKAGTDPALEGEPLPEELAEPAAPQTAPPPTADGPGGEWSYVGATGPASWGKSYPVCGKGKFQAPIELFGFSMVQDLTLEFSYVPAETSLAVTRHALEATYSAPAKAGFITLSGKRFDLVGFHFHTPAEHTLRGEQYEMEIHLVHRNASDGATAVVAVLVSIGGGESTKVFSPLFAATTATTLTVDPTDLLPIYRSFFRYTGSLTTPPCTEGITWLVLTNSIVVTDEQLKTARKLFPTGNARPLQKYRPTLHLGNAARWD